MLMDTAKAARFGRVCMNRTIRCYPAFSEFYGMDETIEQILYLLGPVGGGRSSLAEGRSGLESRMISARRSSSASFSSSWRIAGA